MISTRRLLRAAALVVFLASIASCSAPAPAKAPAKATAPIPAEPIPAAPVGAGSIEVRLRRLDPSLGDGPVQVALWNSEKSFMRSGQWLRGASVAIADADKPVRFDHLPPGTYAISAFHDTRSTGSLRQGPFGIPVDPWAISNGGSLLAPPSWKKAAFALEAGTVVVELDFQRTPRRQP